MLKDISPVLCCGGTTWEHASRFLSFNFSFFVCLENGLLCFLYKVEEVFLADGLKMRAGRFGEVQHPSLWSEFSWQQQGERPGKSGGSLAEAVQQNTTGVTLGLLLCPGTEFGTGGAQLFVTLPLLRGAPHLDTIVQLPPGVAGSDVS